MAWRDGFKAPQHRVEIPAKGEQVIHTDKPVFIPEGTPYKSQPGWKFERSANPPGTWAIPPEAQARAHARRNAAEIAALEHQAMRRGGAKSGRQLLQEARAVGRQQHRGPDFGLADLELPESEAGSDYGHGFGRPGYGSSRRRTTTRGRPPSSPSVSDFHRRPPPSESATYGWHSGAAFLEPGGDSGRAHRSPAAHWAAESDRMKQEEGEIRKRLQKHAAQAKTIVQGSDFDAKPAVRPTMMQQAQAEFQDLRRGLEALDEVLAERLEVTAQWREALVEAGETAPGARENLKQESKAIQQAQKVCATQHEAMGAMSRQIEAAYSKLGERNPRSAAFGFGSKNTAHLDALAGSGTTARATKAASAKKTPEAASAIAFAARWQTADYLAQDQDGEQAVIWDPDAGTGAEVVDPDSGRRTPAYQRRATWLLDCATDLQPAIDAGDRELRALKRRGADASVVTVETARVTLLKDLQVHLNAVARESIDTWPPDTADPAALPQRNELMQKQLAARAHYFSTVFSLYGPRGPAGAEDTDDAQVLAQLTHRRDDLADTLAAQRTAIAGVVIPWMGQPETKPNLETLRGASGDLRRLAIRFREYAETCCALSHRATDEEQRQTHAAATVGARRAAEALERAVAEPPKRAKKAEQGQLLRIALIDQTDFDTLVATPKDPVVYAYGGAYGGYEDVPSPWTA